MYFGDNLPWPFSKFVKDSDENGNSERWNDPYLVGVESKILFYIFYKLSLVMDWLFFRYDDLTHKPKRKKFLIYRFGKLTMFKNTLIGKFGKIPITDLRSFCKPKNFFFRLFIVMVLFFIFK